MIIDRVLGGCCRESREGSRIDACVRKDLLVLSKIQGRNRCCRARANACINTIPVVQDTLAQAGSRHNPGDRNASRVSLAFIVIEEKQFVLYDRPPESTAERIPDKVGKSDTCCVVEKVIRFKETATIKL